MKDKITGKDFVKLHAEGMEELGFWTEEYRSTIIKAIESRYKPEIIRVYCVSDFVVNGEKVLVNWKPRFVELSDQDLKDNYGFVNI